MKPLNQCTCTTLQQQICSFCSNRFRGLYVHKCFHQLSLNIYLENMQQSYTFAAKFKTMMKHLCTYNPLKRLLQNEQICCCSVVHVHWFSGFI